MVIDGRKVRLIEQTNGYISVYCQGDLFKGQLIVGADGASSVVARYLKLMEGMGLSVALEAEVDVQQSTLARWDSLVTIDVGTIPGGYAWVFPKEDHLFIGVVGDVKHIRRLREYYQRFSQAQCLRPHRSARSKDTGCPCDVPEWTSNGAKDFSSAMRRVS